MDQSKHDPNSCASLSLSDHQKRCTIPASISSTSTIQWVSGSHSSTTRTRNRNVVLTSADHNVIHSHQSPSQLPDFPEVGPEFRYIRNLLVALLLATSLACISALDAKHQCKSREANDVYELYDDDNVIQNQMQQLKEESSCLQTFWYVMVPVTAVTLSCCALSLATIRRISSSIEEETKLERQRAKFHVCLRLMLVFPLVLVAWAYGIIVIMLQPRNETGEESENPYENLAAVDSMGHVGANANLYYLSWISVGLATAIFYQICIDCNRSYRRVRSTRLEESDYLGDVEVMLSFTRAQLDFYRETRTTWYNSMYRLRIRSGIWVAALLTSLVVMASSVRLWREVLSPAAAKLLGETPTFRQVCPTLQLYESSLDLPSQLCARTSFSILSGVVAACLCIFAIVIHMLTRQGAAQLVDVDESCSPILSIHHYTDTLTDNSGYTSPLRSELILSVILSFLLGLNAVFATGVQGPASSVGNLYYASWIGFLLCLRVCLGCLEELYNIDKEEQNPEGREEGEEMTLSSHIVRNRYIAPSNETPVQRNTSVLSSSTKSKPRLLQMQLSSMNADLLDNERAQRLRRHLFLAMFSTICTASALDAAFNQERSLSRDQRYLIIAPSLVAVLCILQFFLCLSPECYLTVSKFWVGGLLSIVVFGIWLVDLIITMHSEMSWAVNEVGDIQMANLYYFSWASIIMAGLHMSSYVQEIMGLKQKNLKNVMWLAICKVCFVILGAGLHIWLNIQDTCTLDDNNVHSGGLTICSRTILAIMVALIGMSVGGLVAVCRFFIATFCPTFSPRLRSQVEMIVSVFLVLLFAAAVSLITGIGGPGQSVGDMYYATWVAFLVTIAIAISCYKEVVITETEPPAWTPEQVIPTRRTASTTPFVAMA